MQKIVNYPNRFVEFPPASSLPNDLSGSHPARPTLAVRLLVDSAPARATRAVAVVFEAVCNSSMTCATSGAVSARDHSQPTSSDEWVGAIGVGPHFVGVVGWQGGQPSAGARVALTPEWRMQ